ncbi:hypothetical protein [Thalassotalea sp. ND16A]|uniref:hypothetical protein n=1 Tax=Thalassotalea sp. ND16A TaxID=1535422 RepID=UPI00051A089A|nr:hypothetical protein [Thalassotalea sp. ND16A]KGJ98072.1 hypothetical protein ND16A_0877 [Thalassotalea sp. ND16A]
MKLRVFIFKAPIRVIRIQRRRSVYRFRRQMLTLKLALSQEKAETKEMLSIYRKYTRRQASEEEMQIANRQFLDLLKGLGLGVFAILPFAPITIPVMIKLSRLVGVEILPSSFSQDKNKP